jgi:hypothetical protein
MTELKIKARNPIVTAFLNKIGNEEKPGKHKTGGGCLYIKKLKDVDTEVLKKLIEISVTAAEK